MRDRVEGEDVAVTGAGGGAGRTCAVDQAREGEAGGMVLA